MPDGDDVLKAASLVLLVVLISISQPRIACGQPQPSCLEEASRRLAPNDEIELIGIDGRSIRGRLIALHLQTTTITIDPISGYSPTPETLKVAEIDVIKYRRGGLKPGYMILGLIGGPVAAAIFMGATGLSCGSGWDSIGCGLGVVAGSMALGLTLGIVLPLTIPSEHQIRCY